MGFHQPHFLIINFLANTPVSSLFKSFEVLHDIPGADIDTLEDVHLIRTHVILLAVSHDVDDDIVVHFLLDNNELMMQPTVSQQTKVIYIVLLDKTIILEFLWNLNIMSYCR